MKMIMRLILAAGIFLAAVGVFSPSVRFGSLNWQDPAYVTENPYVTDASMKSLWKALTIQVQDRYIPLTMVSYGLEQAISGGDVRVFHATNIILHGLNAVLILWLMSLLTGSMWAGAAVALIFALHPGRVEAVAWISGRADLLAGFFYFAGLIAYLGHIRVQARGALPLTYVMFFAAVLAHPHSISFPVVLLLLDWFCGRVPVTAYVREKLGIFVGAALAFMVLAGESVSTLHEHTAIFSASLWHKLTLFFYALLTAMGVHLVPLKLSVIYPFPDTQLPDVALVVWLSPLIVMAVGYGVWRSRDRFRAVFAGLAWVALSMLVASGTIWKGESLWHDASMYVASVGLYWALAQTVLHMYRDYAANKVVVIVLPLAFLLYAGYLVRQTTAYLPAWSNSHALWSRVITAFPNVAAYHLRGAALLDLEFADLAVEDFTKAIRLDPGSEDSYLRRAEAYFLQREPDKALEDYRKAIELNPENAKAYFNMGSLYAALGNHEVAVEQFSRAVTLQPDYAKAYQQRGMLYFRLGLLDKALWNFSKVIHLEPQSGEAYFQRAQVFTQLEQWERAIQDYERAKIFYPDEPQISFSLGAIHMARKSYDLAYMELSEALEMAPDFLQARFARAEVLYRLERIPEASADIEQFLYSAPAYGPAYFLRSNINSARGRYEEALSDLRKAQELGFPIPEGRLEDLQSRIPTYLP